jgi:hypothetical protein
MISIRGFTPTLRHEGQLVLDFRPPVTHESRVRLTLPIVRAFDRSFPVVRALAISPLWASVPLERTDDFGLLCPLLTPAPRWESLTAPSVPPRRTSVRDMTQASRGKFDRLPRTPAGCTHQALDGCGLCGHLSARPTWDASNPVSVRQVAVLVHASFRRRLATTPLRFARSLESGNS